MDRVVELIPFFCSRPAVVSWKTFAVANIYSLVVLRADSGGECQRGKGGLHLENSPLEKAKEAKGGSGRFRAQLKMHTSMTARSDAQSLGPLLSYMQLGYLVHGWQSNWLRP